MACPTCGNASGAPLWVPTTGGNSLPYGATHAHVTYVTPAPHVAACNGAAPADRLQFVEY